jgi:hypothetical protein
MQVLDDNKLQGRTRVKCGDFLHVASLDDSVQTIYVPHRTRHLIGRDISLVASGHGSTGTIAVQSQSSILSVGVKTANLCATGRLHSISCFPTLLWSALSFAASRRSFPQQYTVVMRIRE